MFRTVIPVHLGNIAAGMETNPQQVHVTTVTTVLVVNKVQIRQDSNAPLGIIVLSDQGKRNHANPVIIKTRPNVILVRYVKLIAFLLVFLRCFWEH